MSDKNDKNFEYYFQEGLNFFKKGDLNSSLKSYKRAVELNPTRPNMWANMSQVHYKLGQLKETLDCAKKALKLDPQNYVAWNFKGLVLKEKGSLKEALDCFEKSIHYQFNVSALYNKGIILFDQNRDDEALSLFRSALKFKPDNKHTIGMIIGTLEKLEKYQEAIDCYIQYLKINHDDFEALSNIGYFYEKLEDYPKAVEYCNKALEIEPKYSIAHGNKGAALNKLEKWEEAIEALQNALKYDEEDYKVFHSLSFAYFHNNELDNALINIEKAIKLNDSTEELWFLKINILIRQNNFSHALQTIQYFIELFPNNAEAWNVKGIVSMKLNNYDEAILAMDRAIDLESENIRYYINKSKIYFELSLLEEEEKYLKKALEIDSSIYNIYVKLGLNQYKQQQYENSFKTYQKATELNDTNKKIWVYLGIVADILGKREMALDAFNKALNIDENYIVALTNKAMVLKDKHDFNQAIEIINKSLDLDSDRFETWYNAGIIYKELNDPEKEIYCYNKALEIKPNLLQALNNKAIALQNSGDYDEAERTFDKALKNDPENLLILVNKAAFLSEIKALDKAKLIYDKILKLNPDFIPCKINLVSYYIDIHDYSEALNLAKEIRLLFQNIDFFFKNHVENITKKAENANNLMLKLKEADDYFIEALNSETFYQLINRSNKLSEKIEVIVQNYKNKDVPADLIELLISKKICFEILNTLINLKEISLEELENAKNIFKKWKLNDYIVAINSLENLYLNIKEINSIEEITPDLEKRFLLLLKTIDLLDGDFSSIILDMFKPEYLTKTWDKTLSDDSNIINIEREREIWEIKHPNLITSGYHECDHHLNERLRRLGFFEQDLTPNMKVWLEIIDFFLVLLHDCYDYPDHFRNKAQRWSSEPKHMSPWMSKVLSNRFRERLKDRAGVSGGDSDHWIDTIPIEDKFLKSDNDYNNKKLLREIYDKHSSQILREAGKCGFGVIAVADIRREIKNNLQIAFPLPSCFQVFHDNGIWVILFLLQAFTKTPSKL